MQASGRLLGCVLPFAGVRFDLGQQMPGWALRHQKEPQDRQNPPLSSPQRFPHNFPTFCFHNRYLSPQHPQPKPPPNHLILMFFFFFFFFSIGLIIVNQIITTKRSKSLIGVIIRVSVAFPVTSMIDFFPDGDTVPCPFEFFNHRTLLRGQKGSDSE